MGKTTLKEPSCFSCFRHSVFQGNKYTIFILLLSTWNQACLTAPLLSQRPQSYKLATGVSQRVTSKARSKGLRSPTFCMNSVLMEKKQPSQGVAVGLTAWSSCAVLLEGGGFGTPCASRSRKGPQTLLHPHSW